MKKPSMRTSLLIRAVLSILWRILWTGIAWRLALWVLKWLDTWMATPFQWSLIAVIAVAAFTEIQYRGRRRRDKRERDWSELVARKG